MRPIEVDLSPLLINRTAVFTISRDVEQILAASGDFDVRRRFFGRIERDWPGEERARELLGLMTLARQAAEGGKLRDWLPSGYSRGDGSAARALVLDPLYVLFAPLAPDDIVVCHDLSTLTHPEWHEPVVGLLYNEAFRRILEVAPQLISVSRNTADTFYANFGTYRNRIDVVPNYLASFIEQMARRGAPSLYRSACPYFLFVGSLEARKNITGAINAFAVSGLAAEGYRLVIVGGRGRGADDIERRAAEVPGVTLAGYLADEELSSIYAGATGFVYPSYLEGFGVPLLEAMAFGLPCIATTSGASPEVGGPLITYRDPDDHIGMAHDLRAISRLKPEARQRLAAALRQRVSDEFSFELFSARLLGALRGERAEA